MRKHWIWLLLACFVLAGCGDITLLPSQTVPTTAPTTEATVPPTTEAPPEPLALLTEIPETTYAQSIVLTGTADPRYPVEANGLSATADDSGHFSLEIPLEPGENQISLRYSDTLLEYTVIRRYTTAWFLHEAGAICHPDGLLYAEIYAREGSTVEVFFGQQRQTPEPSPNQRGFGVPEGFVRYLCRFDTPEFTTEVLDLGPITYRVTCDGITEEFTTGSVQCLPSGEERDTASDVTPEGYTDVGAGYIVEIIDITAETFDGQTLDDKSRPQLSYLPEGTVDYGSREVYYNKTDDRYYHLLRCGVRVYRWTDNKPFGIMPVVNTYSGTLPDHNEIAVADFRMDGHHTELTLDCLWKAPFFFRQEPQDYYQHQGILFNLDDYDAGYVDITFCYATVFTGMPEIPEDHPLFSSAELIQNEADHTLRLHLKRPGAFYGWTAHYNEQDQLCFRFLNPAPVAPANNAYGADLTGLTIMIDVGHGGYDPGACYSDSVGRVWQESERNLALAFALQEELESIGATVLLNRTDDEYTLSRTERMAYLIEQEPDFCICLHHNANGDHTWNGFSSWYFTPFSLEAAKYIRAASEDTGIYDSSTLSWHFYYICRQSVCPTVLAENGYMSNPKDMDMISKLLYIKLKARDLTQGIVDYYLNRIS